MNIDEITNGYVIDHIAAGKGMDVVRLLDLEDLDGTVAVIRNARSNKMGKKDIIKIEDQLKVNLDVLGFIDPNITVNIIENGEIIGKQRINPPDEVVNVANCKNPRCITSVERELPQVFRKVPGEDVYRCKYCEQEY